VADARFAKPIDQDLVRRLAREHEVLVTVEEGAIGGFATQVMQFMAGEGLLDNGLKFRPLTLPDHFIDQDKPAVQIQKAGLDASAIAAAVLSAFGIEDETLETPARA
jgi:1-deoxy-D-xylulose-5-phosphate synthase